MTAGKTLRPILIPHGIAGVKGNLGCIEVQDGIDCLSLDTGELVFHLGMESKVLFIRDKEMIGWMPESGTPNALRLFEVQIKKGPESLRFLETVTFPDWVDVCSPKPGTFKIEAILEQEKLALSWEAHSRYTGGAPPQEMGGKYHGDAAGIVRIDMRKRTIISSDFRELELEPDMPLRQLIREFPMTPFKQGNSWYNQSWIVDDNECLLLREDLGGQSGLYLMKRKPGNKRENDLFRLSDSPISEPVLSLDGRFVFVAANQGKHKINGTLEWDVFSVASGKRIAVIPLEQGWETVCIVGSQLIYTVGDVKVSPGSRKQTRTRSLKGLTFPGGVFRWSRVILEQQENIEPDQPPPGMSF
jgi:hypothetical protein